MTYEVLKRGARGASVETLQKYLGIIQTPKLKVDGDFGPKTVSAVKKFQRSNGLWIDGVVGRLTWQEILMSLVGLDSPPWYKPIAIPIAHAIAGFHGNESWIHEWEGHAGKPYWPGGASGITLDPGIDVGYSSPDILKGMVRPSQMKALLSVHAKRVRGQKAERLLEEIYKGKSDTLNPIASIRISRTEAESIFPVCLTSYWNEIVKVFPRLLDLNDCSNATVSALHTAFLSLGYNRGSRNRGLHVLKDPLKKGQYRKIGNVIMSMQQNHKLDGIRRRRRAEGDLILSSLYRDHAR